MKWLRRFDVRGSQGDAYTIAIAESGAWGCSCPRWRFSKAHPATGLRPDCKHIEAVKAGLPRNTSRFAVLDMGKGREVAASVEVGTRFRHLDFDMTVAA